MRTSVACCAFASLLLAAPVLAQSESAPVAAMSAPAIKVGSAVRTADNRFLGHIEEVQTSSGQPVTISIIYDQRFIHIPVTTLSPGKGDSVVTSLTMKDITRLQ